MSTELVSLTFNHDPESDRESALNIRIDGTHMVQIPEWVAGRSSQSPAAYALEETVTSVVSIEGRFSGDPNSIVTIRAVPFLNGDFDLFGQIGPLNIIFDANGDSGVVRLDRKS